MFSTLPSHLISDRNLHAFIGLLTLANAFYVGAKNNTILNVTMKNTEYSLTVPRVVSGTAMMILAKEFVYVGVGCFLETMLT